MYLGPVSRTRRAPSDRPDPKGPIHYGGGVCTLARLLTGSCLGGAAVMIFARAPPPCRPAPPRFLSGIHRASELSGHPGKRGRHTESGGAGSIAWALLAVTGSLYSSMRVCWYRFICFCRSLLVYRDAGVAFSMCGYRLVCTSVQCEFPVRNLNNDHAFHWGWILDKLLKKHSSE